MKRKNELYGETVFIGNNIKKILLNRGISYDKAANKLGVNGRQELYYMLTKKLDCYWMEYEIESVCKKLNIKRENLLKGLE